MEFSFITHFTKIAQLVRLTSSGVPPPPRWIEVVLEDQASNQLSVHLQNGSHYERQHNLYYLDCLLQHDWILLDLIENQISQGKKLTIQSEELAREPAEGARMPEAADILEADDHDAMTEGYRMWTKTMRQLHSKIQVFTIALDWADLRQNYGNATPDGYSNMVEGTFERLTVDEKCDEDQ
ncbi:MAG: hypothetical protein Q9212_003805 [Teloschistes hypoglaucus]